MAHPPDYKAGDFVVCVPIKGIAPSKFLVVGQVYLVERVNFRRRGTATVAVTDILALDLVRSDGGTPLHFFADRFELVKGQ